MDNQMLGIVMLKEFQSKKTITHPLCVKCEQRYRRDCFALPRRYYIKRQDKHRWQDCP
jgi:hypothetical protein